MTIHKTIPKTDLHCHIPASSDDLTEYFEAAEDLIEAEQEQGITQIALTPHFCPENDDPKEFILKRNRAKLSLEPIIESTEIGFKFGSEVALHPNLQNIDLAPFCFEGTKYLLLEWPLSTYPLWAEDVIEKILAEGITPIFSHIERYDYLFNSDENCDILENLRTSGCLCQMNAETILRPQTQHLALHLLKLGVVDIISSDCYSPTKRPPNLNKACELVKKKLGDKVLRRLLFNADDIFNGREIEKEDLCKFKLFSFLK